MDLLPVTAARDRLLEALAGHVYGDAPPAPPIAARRTATGELKHGTWETWELTVWPGAGPLSVLLCLPHGPGPAPCHVGFNFRGNHSLGHAPIPVPGGCGANGPPDERDRGRSTADWCVEASVRRGWALCTAFYGELEPDTAEGPSLSRTWRSQGLQAGAITAWAWLLSRLVDLLVADQRIDRRRLVAVGHSRLGKTALLATARDQRLAMVVANGSGCGGAAPFRDPSPGGETLARILHFTHWFNPKLGPDPLAVPVDMQHLIACCAPRAVLLTNAEDDDWADQSGQLRALHSAAPAWRVLGREAAPPPALPELGSGPAGRILRYAWRVGPHIMCPADWAAVFAAEQAELPG